MKKFTKIQKINEQEVTLETPVQSTETEETTQTEQPKQPVVTSQVEQPTEVDETEPTQNVSKFFSKLFESREMAHVYHLQVKDTAAYASHMALNDYYEDVVDIIDDVIEVYQGQYGIVEEYDVIDTSTTKSKVPLDYFNELATYIKDNRLKVISQEDTHIQTFIDDILGLVYKTIYKLTNLK